MDFLRLASEANVYRWDKGPSEQIIYRNDPLGAPVSLLVISVLVYFASADNKTNQPSKNKVSK